MKRIIINLIVILLAQHFSAAAAFGDETCELNREMEQQCRSYTYSVVKPMLDYLRQVSEYLMESESKDRIIGDLREKLVQKENNIEFIKESQENNVKLIKELRSQIELQNTINGLLTESNGKCKEELASKSKKFARLEVELNELNSSHMAKSNEIAKMNNSNKNLELQLEDQKNKIPVIKSNLNLCQIKVEELSKLESQIKVQNDRLTIESNHFQKCKKDLVDKSNKIKVCEVQLINLNSSLIEKDEFILKNGEEILGLTIKVELNEVALKESQSELLIKEIDNQLCQAEIHKLNLPSDCFAFDRNSGIHKINVFGFGSFDVLCENDRGDFGWLVIQKRVIHGKVSFDRDWAAYREGFGSMQGDFFLGLEKIHQLTKLRRHELCIRSIFASGGERESFFLDFEISNEDTGYALRLGVSNLQHHFINGMKFTTYDRDNDNERFVNCAADFGFGWWYNDCNW
ncbi:angiopoietin-related protein 4-like [Drosophila sulfurigaster albostrigata]|uniref:angiopoietin-related protein 4-like n=1 Tax=Drosophila sulfurigaster albostrigata TaxID=89887 RepID=UPI002D21BA97|nr:angiopoietin-related protein 4-like [Drosophila sulfurigaster albostrigata]